MTKTISILLDLLRFVAAIVVVVGHLTQSSFSSGWPDLTIYAVSAVSVFFVLSGFVISFVTDTKETQALTYTVARISRLYSVLVPALVLSGLVLLIAVRLDPQFVGPWSGAQSSSTFFHAHPVIRFFFQCLLALLFLNSIHGYEVAPGVNSPVWSLSFEAAYYALFGVALFTRGYKRVFFLVICCLLFGSGMLRLLPVWLCGVGVHRFIKRSSLQKKEHLGLGLLCFAGTVAAIVAWPSFIAWTNGPHGYVVDKLLHGPGRTSDAGVFYYWGVATSLFILGFHFLEQKAGRILLPLEKPIRWAAAHTFSLYLFHFPLLVLLYVTTHYNRSSTVAKAIVFLVVVGCCVLLSSVSEYRKLWWRRVVQRWMTHLVS
jgi:peptidoglycan/LPS O-acetylase OafA/YrhL